MKKLLLICLNLVLLSSNSATIPQETNRLKEYKSQKYKVSFSYPETWILEGATAEVALLYLYSPEAIEKREQTFDLVQGIKIEFYFFHDPESEELKTFLACEKKQTCKKLKQNAAKTNQCSCEKADILIITTHLQGPKLQTVIVGYIPEKSKRKIYLSYYNKIVQSFAYEKSGPE